MSRRLHLSIALPTLLGLLCGSIASAQQPDVHYRWPAQNPTGSVGMQRLTQGGPVVGYFQPVQVSGPTGLIISLADQGEWTEPVEGSVDAGLLIGKPYRFKVSGMELHPDRECYPTIEIIDRTYPPPGMERRFPIPVVLNENDLDLAMRGMLVTRVIYIEDPHQALPGPLAKGDQNWFDAGPSANPLQTADQLGRPVAILRLGGRVPNEAGGPDWEFMYGCPPWRELPPPVLLNPTSIPADPATKTARRTTAAAQ